VTAIKENIKGQDGHFKNTQAFIQREKACSDFQASLSSQKRNHARFAFKWFYQCPSWPINLFFITKFYMLTFFKNY